MRSKWLWWLLRRCLRLLGAPAHSILRLADRSRLPSTPRPQTPEASEPLVRGVELQDDRHLEAALPLRVVRRTRAGPVAESAHEVHLDRTGNFAGGDNRPAETDDLATPAAGRDQRECVSVSDVWTWLGTHALLSCEGLQRALHNSDLAAMAPGGAASEAPTGSTAGLTRMGALLDWRRRAGAAMWSLCGVPPPQSSIGPAGGCEQQLVQPATSVGRDGACGKSQMGIDWDVIRWSGDTGRFLATWDQVRWSGIFVDAARSATHLRQFATAMACTEALS